ITCLGVAIPTLFLNADLVLDLCSMGTLFAFMFVSAGVLVLETQPNEAEKASGFRVPYINGRWIMPVLFVAYLVPCVAGWLPENHQVLSPLHWSTAIQEMDLTRIPYLVFFLVFLVFSVLAVRGNWSVINRAIHTALEAVTLADMAFTPPTGSDGLHIPVKDITFQPRRNPEP
ncbi:MAG: hypothetical protein ACOYLM_07070, partial [Methylococcaceae bacterium]